jgi:hypothetical protein
MADIVAEVQTGVEIAQIAVPLVEELVSFFKGLFAKHAPAATVEHLAVAANAAAQVVVSQVEHSNGSETVTPQHVAAAVAEALLSPTPVPEVFPARPVAHEGVHFGAGSGLIRR